MITEEQRLQRRSYIGSSDAPTIVGVNPWANLADLYLEKTGKVSPKKENASIDAGNILEPAILSFAEREIGSPLRRDVPTLIHPDGIRAANLDGWITSSSGDAAIVEAKSSGIVTGFVDEEWGEPGTDDVPDRVRVQVQHQMIVAAAALGIPFQVAYVPALLARRGFVLFAVPYNEELATTISEAELDFWTSFVVPKIPPPDDYLPSLDTLKRIRREAGLRVPLEYAYVLRWKEAQAVRLAAEKAEKTALAEMLARLGEAEVGECEGQGVLTYAEQTRKSYVAPESTYRVPRWKAVKA